MASYKKSEITKETILSAATELFLEQGYRSTTIRDLCARSGVSLSRVNYHFSSKADLAAIICREMLRNLYTELRNAMHSEREYSLIAEAVSLRFLVHLICEDGVSNPSGAFYRDVAEEGILGDVFTPQDQNLFSQHMANLRQDESPDLTERIGTYSRIFGSSFSSLHRSFHDLTDRFGGDKEKAEETLQDILSGLSLQMMDIEHEVQHAMVDLSRAYYRLMDIRLTGLTQVSVVMRSPLSLRDKVRLIEPYMDSDRIRLKSSADRSNIELDAKYRRESPEGNGKEMQGRD